MSVEELELGIIGFGNMGRLHAEQLKYLPNVRVSAIVDTDEKNREDARNFFGQRSVGVFSDVDEALNASEVRTWVVASSTDTHIHIVERLLKRACKVLLEKPIATTLEEAESIRSLVHENSANVMMGHILLWHREFLAVKSLLPEVGKIHSIFASRQRSRDHRVRYPKETPFSLTMVHDLYSVFALLSGASPSSLFAQQRAHEQGGIDLALAEITWRTPEEILAIFHANFLLPKGLPGGSTIDDLQISGENGVIRLNYESGYLTVLSAGAAREVEVPRPKGTGLESFFDDALRRELENFVDVARNQGAVPIGARYEDACQIQNWIESLIKSAESGSFNNAKCN